MFSFSPYSSTNKDDWMQLVDELLSSNTIANDEIFLEKKSVFNLVIYMNRDDGKKTPIAIFLSSGINAKFKGLIKVLDANSGGLYISGKYKNKSWKVKEYFNKIIKEYFIKVYQVDVVEFMQTPFFAINNPALEYISNPGFSSFSLINSILYMDLVGNPIENLSANSRNQVKRGLKYIQDRILLEGRNQGYVDFLVKLDHYKSKRLGIKPFAREYFEQIIQSKQYNVLICMDEKGIEPISCIVYSIVGFIGDFIYMAGVEEARKYFVNKALLYTAMNKSKLAECDYFILGVGCMNVGNMKEVTVFKKEMSSNEVSCNFYRSPVSIVGKLYCSLLFFLRK